jgi:hypothetical protein
MPRLGRGRQCGLKPCVTMERVFAPEFAAPWTLWLRSPRAETKPGDQLGREGMIDAGLVGGDARITIRRESPDDVGFREIFVSMDGEQIAILRPSETFSLEVPPGPHRLRAHNTLFWKTHDVVLKPGEHARFVAINRAGFGTFGFMTFLGASPLYLTFERDRDPK